MNSLEFCYTWGHPSYRYTYIKISLGNYGKMIKVVISNRCLRFRKYYPEKVWHLTAFENVLLNQGNVVIREQKMLKSGRSIDCRFQWI